IRSNRLLPIGFLVLSSWLVLACLGYAASLSESLTIGYSSFSGHYVPLWIAIEDQLGKKYGLDLKAVYAGRARPQQLLMSGEMLFVVATGTGALTSHVLGVKDQIIVLTFVNRVPGVIVARPEIKSSEDLKGKVIGTGRPGALADTMVRYVLQGKMNLVPDRELINYEKLGIVYPYNTVTTLKPTVNKKSEVLEKVLKTMIEGIAMFKTNKEKSISVWRKYLRGASDDILEESYQSTVGELERVPAPSVAVIKSGLDVLSLQYPQAKQTDPSSIIDSTIVKRIEQSGFIDALYKK